MPEDFAQPVYVDILGDESEQKSDSIGTMSISAVTQSNHLSLLESQPRLLMSMQQRFASGVDSQHL